MTHRLRVIEESVKTSRLRFAKSFEEIKERIKQKAPKEHKPVSRIGLFEFRLLVLIKANPEVCLLDMPTIYKNMFPNDSKVSGQLDRTLVKFINNNYVNITDAPARGCVGGRKRKLYTLTKTGIEVLHEMNNRIKRIQEYI